MLYNSDGLPVIFMVYQKVYIFKCHCWYILPVFTRAVQLIEFDSHAHLVSKAGSVIGAKSPSPVFKRSSS